MNARMEEVTRRISGWSPAKRALLEHMLQKMATAAPSFHAIPPRAQGAHPPLSFAQQRQWFMSQLEPDSTAYNIPVAVRLNGPIRVRLLQQSLEAVVARHESLRTAVTVVDGSPVQVIAEQASVDLPIIDLTGLSHVKRESQALQLAQEEINRPFDLEKGPLLRVTLLRLGVEEHILLLTLHHIVADGWSLSILFRELSAAYDAKLSGEPLVLPELAIQYADFAVWQRQWLQGANLEKQLTYWTKRLNGAPPVLNLPTDRPRPAAQSYRGARQSFVFPARLTAALTLLSQQQGTTLFMTLLAAFQILLQRYTGQDDIVVGLPVAGRSRSEIEPLIGFLVNTLVLRTDLSANPTFLDHLSQVRHVCLEAFAHQDLPFERLVEELQPERDPSRNPLFQVLLRHMNTPSVDVKLPGLNADLLEVDHGSSKFDLTLSIIEESGGLRGFIEYSTDLFEPSTIRRMLGHFRTLLDGIVSNPGLHLSDLPLLTQSERSQLLVEWNDTRSDAPIDNCVQKLFEAQAEQTPESIAVVFEDEQLTYDELNQRANQLAHHLQRLGVGPEVLVGLCVERSLEMVIGLLGVLKAGGAYLPLDPSYPKERLAFMLEDSGVQVVLTQERLVDRLPQHGTCEVRLDTHWETIACESPENPASGVTADNLAYLIYTSGSTGTPKGVQIEHRAVVNFLHSMRQHLSVTSRDHFIAVTSVSFDIAVLELFLPMMIGARVIVMSREVGSDGTRLLEEIVHSGATVMQATPVTWRMLLEAGWQGSRQLHILCGGEELTRELADQLLDRGASLWNLYGPTETTIWSTVSKVESRSGPVSIGRPIANTQIYVLDRYRQPVPVGIPGELYIGGVGLSRGYRNRPELTTEKFIQHPVISDALGTRLYRTGDRARYMADGGIEYLGRIDHQVKIRGFRIELGEIEVTLSQHSSVRQAVVLAREDVPGNKTLVAYLITDHLPIPSGGELRSFLMQTLPDYMLPSSYVFLDCVPLTPNGKLDRRALPAPDQARSAMEEPSVVPCTEMELLIADVWQELLGVDRVSVYDNFFDLGGHSLLSVQMIVRLEKKLGLHINFREVIFQTLGQIAALCEQRLQSTQAPRPRWLPRNFSAALKRTIFRL